MHAAVGHYHATVPTHDYVASATPWTDPYANYDSDASAHSVHSVHSQRGAACSQRRFPRAFILGQRDRLRACVLFRRQPGVRALRSASAWLRLQRMAGDGARTRACAVGWVVALHHDAWLLRYQSDASIHSHHSYVAAGPSTGAYHDGPVGYDSDASAHSQRSYALQPPSVDYYSDASVHSHHSYTNAPAPFHNPAQ
jgi:hypothetical protein